MTRGIISPEIPLIHQKAVDVLYEKYEAREQAFAAFDGLGEILQGDRLLSRQRGRRGRFGGAGFEGHL
ncbi:MAG: hypothetical protein MZV49_25260 [Rhodopseudomonas palustris]|nr:hypothetical protein [Rhodopseudomonas palustris]